MNSLVPDFPTRSRLWRGVVLSTIAHALREAQLGFAPDHQWPDPHNYVMNYEQGDLGVVTFRDDVLVAALFDHESHRSPFPAGAGAYDIERYFVGMPAHLRALANAETLQYMLQDLGGNVQPVITAAFWGEGERLTAAEAWADVWTNSAYQLRVQLMEPEEALAEVADNYDFPPSRVRVIRSLFERRMTQPSGPLAMTPAERWIFLENGHAGIDESRQLLAAIGILMT